MFAEHCASLGLVNLFFNTSFALWRQQLPHVGNLGLLGSGRDSIPPSHFFATAKARQCLPELKFFGQSFFFFKFVGGVGGETPDINISVNVRNSYFEKF